MENPQPILNFIKRFYKYRKGMKLLLNDENEVTFSCSLFKMEIIANFIKNTHYEELVKKIEENSDDN